MPYHTSSRALEEKQSYVCVHQQCESCWLDDRTYHGEAFGSAECVEGACLGAHAGGSLTRASDQDRIEFLAQARNRALEPLWLNGSLPTSTSLLLPHDQEVRPLKGLRVFISIKGLLNLAFCFSWNVNGLPAELPGTLSHCLPLNACPACRLAYPQMPLCMLILSIPFTSNCPGMGQRLQCHGHQPNMANKWLPSAKITLSYTTCRGGEA